jgi:hypothetical protein
MEEDLILDDLNYFKMEDDLNYFSICNIFVN